MAVVIVVVVSGVVAVVVALAGMGPTCKMHAKRELVAASG